MYNSINLPYNDNDLQPYIDEQTVNIHYNKHYKKYLSNLNKLISNIKLEDIPKKLEELPLEKRGTTLYNAGGVLNHELYFIGLNKQKSNPKGKLQKKINETYGNFENFKNIFISKAKLLTGSGYTFLVTDNFGNLSIINLPNQETPYTYNLIPLFAIDMWEHAYYLKYKNEKELYLENIWNITNFDNATNIYENLLP